jgi:hypothetical protein
MGILDRMRLESALFRKGEEALHRRAVQEIQSGHRREGLWAKALIRANGDPYRSESEYLKLLVRAIRDDAIVADKMRQENEVIEHNLRIQEQQQRELQNLQETLEYHSTVRRNLTLKLIPVFIISWMIGTVFFYLSIDVDLVTGGIYGLPFAALAFLIPYGLLKAIMVRGKPLPAGERQGIWYWALLILFGIASLIVLNP